MKPERFEFWHALAWGRPWLAPYRAAGERVVARLEGGAGVAEALNAAAADSAPLLPAGRLRFVSAQELPRGEPYETFIARSACVPTRDNLHDLLNGLVWLAFAPLKRRLNALHAEQIALSGVGPKRGAVRDALTLLDENGAFWQAPAGLVDALQQRDWQALFVQRRAAWLDARLTLFGHALLEKLCQPRKAITAHVWPLPLGVDPQEFLVDALSPQTLAARPCLALPVLGVPGWWPQNQQPDFYADARVFRPSTAQTPERPLNFWGL